MVHLLEPVVAISLFAFLRDYNICKGEYMLFKRRMKTESPCPFSLIVNVKITFSYHHYVCHIKCPIAA